jgi:hypothetical protein
MERAERSDKTRDTQLDVETRTSIRLLCADYGIRATTYFELSNLNAPGPSPVSYGIFNSAMSGGFLSVEQEAAIARSLGVVRQELRKQGQQPLEKSLPKKLAAVLSAHFADDSDGVLTTQELGDMKRLINRAHTRIK